MATHEFVVPKSIPITLLINSFPIFLYGCFFPIYKSIFALFYPYFLCLFIFFFDTLTKAVLTTFLQHITCLYFLRLLSWFSFIIFYFRHSLMKIWIKFFIFESIFLILFFSNIEIKSFSIILIFSKNLSKIFVIF